MQVIKNTFFETGFVINNKPPLKKVNSYAWLDYVVTENLQEYISANGGKNLDHNLS